MKKLFLLLGFFLLFSLAIIIKLFYIQVVGIYSNASNEYLKIKKIIPDRGQILDRNNSPLALNQTTYKLFIEPKNIKNKDELVKKIDDVLHIGIATIEAKINPNLSWIAIKSNLSKSEKDQIDSFKLLGVGFDEEQRRFYPEGSLSAHVLGFVSKPDGIEDRGSYGIEGFYDKDLAGLPGVFKTERDLSNNPMLGGVQEKLTGENGRNLVLTIDKTVQMIAKSKLKSGVEKYSAKEGCITIVDPNNLEILAMSCLPDFDSSTFNVFPSEFYTNTSITSLYEPGSIFKPLIMAAGLNEKVIKENDTFDESGPIIDGQFTIRNWNNKYEGKISMSKILEKSSNIGMVYVGEKLGKDKIYNYLEKYGLSEPTEIDLQGEATGTLKQKNNWYDVDYKTATFGQGISTTQIRMITAFASLINGGYLLKPHIVLSINNSNGIEKVDKKIIRRVITEETSKTIKKMLLNVVENGEVKWAKPDGYKIGGKTGTAQVAVSGKYDASKTTASFIGFAPYEKPKFLILVTLKEPSASIWGSETAAPIFFEVAKELLVYYNIAPGD